MAVPIDRVYYQNVRDHSLAHRIGYVARSRVYDLFLSLTQPCPNSRILDIGVTDDVASPAANLLEQLYPYPGQLVCVGLSDGAIVKAKYPNISYEQIRPAESLPFGNEEFDIVYSNAVLEHVGSLKRQAQFVAEACRVARSVFMVVPNRLFPVEVHTGIPLLHYLPQPLFRNLFRRTPFPFWSHESNLNYISVGGLKRVFQPYEPKLFYAGVGWGPFRSNIVAYLDRGGKRDRRRISK
jgi:hypothetical protein